MSSSDFDASHQLFEQREKVLVERQMKSLEVLAAGVSHEFNNLLTGIGGYAQLASQSPDNTQLRERAFEAIIRAVKHGTTIVDKLKHFGRHSRPDWETVPFSDLIRDTVELWQAEAVHRGVDVETDFTDGLEVRGDASLLSLSVLEVLRNALDALIDMPPERRQVRIVLRQEDGDVVLRVQDSGPGLTDEQRRMALEPFASTRSPLGGGSTTEATGLGLSAVRGIVLNHGGTLDLEMRDGGGLEVRIGLKPVRSVRSGKGRVLVVDDDRNIRRIFTRFLTGVGYAADEAENGLEALEAVAEIHYDLILLDQMMPRLDGLGVLNGLPGAAGDKPVPPVVMITAAHSASLAREAINRGASVCVAKPLNRAKLVFLADSHVGNLPRMNRAPARTKGERNPADRLLILDPDPISREVQELVLNHAGYRVTAVETGKKAIRATESEYYDLILIDPMLHDAIGMDVLQKLHLNNPYTPILLSSSEHMNRNAVRRAKKAGVVRCITKPFDVHGLLGEVERLIDLFHGEGGPDLSKLEED